MAKTLEGSTLARLVASKPPADGTSKLPTEKKSTFMSSTSNQPAIDQPIDDKKKGTTDKDFLVDPNDSNKKLRLNMELDPK
jgi:hypothetical protein